MSDISANVKILLLDNLSERLDVPIETVIKSMRGNSLPFLKYFIPKAQEQSELLIEVSQSLDKLRQYPSLDQRIENWDKRWNYTLDRIKTEGVNINSLRPTYFGNRLLRLDGQFILAPDDNFEFDMHVSILRVLFEHYLSEIDLFIELGCGTGLNLFLLSQMFPTGNFWGGDWASASQKILSLITQETKTNINSFNFNFKNMGKFEQINLPKRSAILTIHALEQVGSKFENTLKFILEQNVELVFHIEPLIELYNQESELDNVALIYHRHLNYLTGYLPEIRRLEKAGDIEILECRRLGFGGTWHEAYGLLVWRHIQ